MKNICQGWLPEPCLTIDGNKNSLSLSLSLSVCLSVCLSVLLSVCLSFARDDCQNHVLPLMEIRTLCLSLCHSLSVCLSVPLSVCLSVWNYCPNKILHKYTEEEDKTEESLVNRLTINISPRDDSGSASWWVVQLWLYGDSFRKKRQTERRRRKKI